MEGMGRAGSIGLILVPFQDGGNVIGYPLGYPLDEFVVEIAFVFVCSRGFFVTSFAFGSFVVSSLTRIHLKPRGRRHRMGAGLCVILHDPSLCSMRPSAPSTCTGTYSQVLLGWGVFQRRYPPAVVEVTTYFFTSTSSGILVLWSGYGTYPRSPGAEDTVFDEGRQNRHNRIYQWTDIVRGNI